MRKGLLLWLLLLSMILLATLFMKMATADDTTNSAQLFLSSNLLRYDTNQLYDYAPSVMVGDYDYPIRMWWTTPDVTDAGDRSTDSIWYGEWIGGTTWRNAQKVFTPTHASNPLDPTNSVTNPWDSGYVADPTVIRAVPDNPWKWDGQTYTYALYYTASNDWNPNLTNPFGINGGVGNYSGLKNQIGVAFSNDGKSWRRWPYPVISWSRNPDIAKADCNWGNWGAGQPSAFNTGGDIYLAYTDSTKDCKQYLYVVKSVGPDNFGNKPSPIDFDNVNKKKIPLGPDVFQIDIAFNIAEQRWHAATAYNNQENQIQLWKSYSSNIFDEGAWELQGRIGVASQPPFDSGGWWHMNPGLFRDRYGNIYTEGGTDHKFVAYGRSQTDLITNTDIWWAAFHNHATNVPTVSITNPADGSKVKGTVNFSANMTYASGVKFYVDGVLKANDTISPYTYSWNSTQVADGAHTLKAEAYSSAGPSAFDSHTVTVNNTSYQKTYLASEWISGGTALGVRGDDTGKWYTLPFSFPFYGVNYTSAYINSNGLLNFKTADTSYSNSTLSLKNKTAIAPLWDDLRTNARTYDNVYIIRPDANTVVIRWQAVTYSGSYNTNFEVVLSKDGRIKFNYGAQSGGLGQTIGISKGDGINYLLAHEAKTNLNYAQTVLFYL